MAAFARGLPLVAPLYTSKYICSRCLQFSTASVFQSGHSRWSKIKHDKGVVDAKKNAKRTAFAHELTLSSKLYGPDPAINNRLAAAIVNAKKAGFPKASIEAAIARGRGISASGATLESLTLEAIMPPSCALVIDIETDNRLRALSDIRFIVTKRKGTITPTNYLFTKRGLVVFEKQDKIGVDEVLEDAIEAGAEDVEIDEEGGLIVWTEPSGVTKAADQLAQKHGLKVSTSEIIWDPNEDTLVPLETDETGRSLLDLIMALQDNSDVQGVYANVAQGSVDGKLWSELEEKLAS